MSTFKDENPITYRIEKMRANWVENVADDTQLVRWIVQKDEVRMVKAFALLESSEHGQIPDLFINFDIPFSTEQEYGLDLLNNWLSIWNNEDARAEVADANVLPDWDDTPFQDAPVKNSEESFLDAMSSFAESIDPKQKLGLNVMPSDFMGEPGFVEWVLKCLEIMPENLRFMIFDLDEIPLFHKIPMHFRVSSLMANLNMSQATREIVQQGDANDPSVGVNLCLLNIAEATNDKNEDDIHKWGKEGVEIAEKTGLKSIVATIYLAYGSAFFQLKKMKEAIRLFKLGEEQALAGAVEEDVAIPAVILQVYNFQAAAYLYRKKYEEARECFLKSAEESLRQKNVAMYLESQRQASIMSEKLYDTKAAYDLTEEAYEKYKTHDKLQLKFTSMLLICNRLYDYAYDEKNKPLIDEIDEFATDIWGEHWKDASQKEMYQSILTTE